MFEAMRRLILLFSAQCDERSTLDDVLRVLSDRALWITAHDLFQRIRTKTLAAEKAGDARLIAQYDFEEACAKALYNCGAWPKGEWSESFKPDAPYYIAPAAIRLSRALGLEDAAVLDILAG